jgi:uncharacterized protein (TIGR03067 family)
MKPQWLLILGLVVLSGADPTEDVGKKELTKSEGTWAMTAVEFDGNAPVPQDITIDVRQELKKLEGTWVMTAVEFDGNAPLPQDVTTDARRECVISGNKYTDGQVGDLSKKQRLEGFFRIDPSKKPKTLDYSPTQAFKPGETYPEIYELDGDTLKICGAGKEKMKPEDRPQEFKTGPKSGLVISYWKRKP